MNRTDIGKQLSGFVGRDIDSQFVRPRRRLYAERDTVAEELVTKTFENGKTWTWNPAKESEPDPETGRTKKYDEEGNLFETGLSISNQLGKVGGTNLFGQATLVQPDKVATGQKVPVSVVPEIVNKEDVPDPYPVRGDPNVGTTKGLSSRLGTGALAAGLTSFIPFVGGSLSEKIMDDRVEEVEGVLGPYDPSKKGPYKGSGQIFDPSLLSTEQAEKGLPSLKAGTRDPGWVEKVARKIGMPVADVIAKYGQYSPYVDEGMKISKAAQEGGFGLAEEPESKEDKAKRLELTQEHIDAGHANQGQWGRDNKYYQYDPETGNWLNARGEGRNTTIYGKYIGSGKKGYGQYDLTNPNHPGHKAYMEEKKRREEGEHLKEEKDPVTYPKDVFYLGNLAKERLDREKDLARKLNAIVGTGPPLKGEDDPYWPEPEEGPSQSQIDTQARQHPFSLTDTSQQEHWDDITDHPTFAYEDFGSQIWATGGAIPFSLGGGLSSIENQHLEPGSFVLAADVVSGAGDGDTGSGLKRLHNELGIPIAPSGTQGSSTGGPISGSIRGPGSGLDDMNQTSIDGRIPAALSNGETVLARGSVARIAQLLHPDKKMTSNEALKLGQEGLFNLQKNIRKQKAGTSKGGKQPGPLKTGRGGLLDLMRA